MGAGKPPEDVLYEASPAVKTGVEAALRPYLDWADTVFLDWCTAPAGMLTAIDPGTTRVIVRLHSYETLTRWPHVVVFSRVFALVFVARNIRDLFTAMRPAA